MAKDALPPEHLIYEIAAPGKIMCAGYVISCPDCGATSGWSLRVQQRPWTCGEEAWALCPLEHLVWHPLIYPAMVHALIGWAATDTHDRPTAEQVLADIAWRPHYRHVHLADYSDELDRVWYEPWEAPGFPMLDWWEDRWPGLVEASHHQAGTTHGSEAPSGS